MNEKYGRIQGAIPLEETGQANIRLNLLRQYAGQSNSNLLMAALAFCCEHKEAFELWYNKPVAQDGVQNNG